MPCPADPELGQACMRSRKRSRYIFYASAALFIFATIFTYLFIDFEVPSLDKLEVFNTHIHE